MPSENYTDAIQAFDWSAVYEALGWEPDRKVSLGDSIVDRHAATERVALICVGLDGTERRLTYRELSQASNRFANLLQRLGVEPGDRVAGLMPRGPEVIIAIIGALKLGAIYVPIFTGFGPDFDLLPARSLPSEGPGDASGYQETIAIRLERPDHLRFEARRRASSGLPRLRNRTGSAGPRLCERPSRSGRYSGYYLHLWINGPAQGRQHRRQFFGGDLALCRLRTRSSA